MADNEPATVDAATIAPILEQLRTDFKQMSTEMAEARRSGDAPGVAALGAEIDGIRETVAALTGALSNTEGLFSDDSKAKLVVAQETNRKRDALRRIQEHYSERIGDAVEETDLDWESAKELSGARAEWKRGNFVEADRLTHKVAIAWAKAQGKPAPKDGDNGDDGEETVDDKVTAALKTLGVTKQDTKEGSVVTSVAASLDSLLAQHRGELMSGSMTLAQLDEYTAQVTAAWKKESTGA